MYHRIVLCLAATLAISGCAPDYLNNYDTMTLASGDTNNTNSLLQTVNPFNPNSNNAHIEGDSQRMTAAVQRYRGVAPPGATLGRVPNSSVDLDCAGGKGNNPVVQGPVAVGPSDPNGLDRNHNGIGCEN
ncbi:MAG: calcium-binding protein [Hyphomicrobiales bacterium]|nr:MAG: calcium-binding protein [Hyphomicrobiales bacterium]